MRGKGSKESPIDIDDSEEEVLQELFDSSLNNSEPRRDNNCQSPQHQVNTLSTERMALGGATVTDQNTKGSTESGGFNVLRDRPSLLIVFSQQSDPRNANEPQPKHKMFRTLQHISAI